VRRARSLVSADRCRVGYAPDLWDGLAAPEVMTLLVLLDEAFFAFHALLIAFNMLGWAWRRTRPAHLLVLGLTAFSWFVMGAYYGWGYCLCTDWHFRVRRRLGYAVPESSFIQLFIAKAIGLRMGREASNTLAVGVFAAIVIATAIAWTVDCRRRASTGPAAQSEATPQ
jgi:hypothetical protein